jgi:AraC-like DNA-binding protein
MANVFCVFAWMLPVKASFRCRIHAHDCTEIVFIRGAAGLLHQGGAVHSYRNGTVFSCQPGNNHWIHNQKPGEHICLGIAGGQAERITTDVRQADSRLVQRFDEIIETLGRQDGTTQDRLDLLAGLVVCDLLSSQPSQSQRSVSKAHQARHLIERSLSVSLSLSQLAKRVFVSPDYLRKMFRSEFGETITHYILRRRLELAAKLLLTTPLLVKEIAVRSGFQTEYYFSRAFRKAQGVSPTQYRKRKTT